MSVVLDRIHTRECMLEQALKNVCDEHALLMKFSELEEEVYNYEDFATVVNGFYYAEEEESLRHKKLQDIMDDLERKAYNTYRSRRDVGGLMLLKGMQEEDALEVVDTWRRKKFEEFEEFYASYRDDVDAWRRRLRVRKYEVTSDGDVLYNSGAGGDVVPRHRKGFIPFVPSHAFILTSTFRNFVNKNWDYVSLSGGRRSMSLIKQYNRYERVKAASILRHFVGKDEACRLVAISNRSELKVLGIVRIDTNTVISSNYTIVLRDLTGDVSFIADVDVLIKYRGWSRVKASKIRKEVRKLIYQFYKDYINKYYSNDKLDEHADIEYLIKNSVVGEDLQLRLLYITAFSHIHEAENENREAYDYLYGTDTVLRLPSAFDVEDTWFEENEKN